MTEILEKVKRKMEQLNHRIETRRGVNYYDESKRLMILDEKLGVYEDLLPDIASLITTIECQKEEIEKMWDVLRDASFIIDPRHTGILKRISEVYPRKEISK